MSGTTPITQRPALAALPLHQRPKSSTIKTSLADMPRLNMAKPLTPPSTPPKPENNRASASANDVGARPSTKVAVGGGSCQKLANAVGVQKTEGEQKLGLRLYNKKYQLHEELGRGVWSNVYRANELLGATSIPNIFPLSPPISPTSASSAIRNETLAVKKPSRRDAHKILEIEARTLTYLHSHDEALSYLIPFHGFDVTQNSIVLDAVPLSLEKHAKSAGQRPLSTKTMFDPVIGAVDWIDLAEGLISGLEFLHNKGCIHGDIKPANILLRPDENGKLVPLYCDFSSSRVMSSTTRSEDVEEVSAVTADYTSPELLESLHNRSNERAVVTFASDVFALAVTLIYGAIGESPYASARMEIQKLGMAKDGAPLEYARRGEQASRVMEGWAVDRALKGALLKDPRARLKVEEWKHEVEAISNTWRDGGWSRGG